MTFFERPMLAVLLPVVAWSLVGAMKLYLWKHGYGTTMRPTSDEILFAQILLAEGVVLCMIALVPVIGAWRAKRLDRFLIGSAIASSVFLIWWAPSAMGVLLRKTGVLT
jgi:hypothetical protein